MDIGVVLAYVGNEQGEAARSVALRDVKVVLTSAEVVHNHYIPRVDRNILEVGRGVDIHQDPVYCNKVPREDLSDRTLQHHLIHRQEIHAWEEIDCNNVRPDENWVAVAF